MLKWVLLLLSTRFLLYCHEDDRESAPVDSGVVSNDTGSDSPESAISTFRGAGNPPRKSGAAGA